MIDIERLLPLLKRFPTLDIGLSATGALVTDPDDRVLMVKPHHNPHWTLVGGMVDVGERPDQALAREIREELGVELPVGDLLVLDWAPPLDQRPLPIHYTVFDCGVVAPDTPIRLQSEELAEYAWLTVPEATGRLADNVAHRLPAAVAARRDGRAVYLPTAARDATDSPQ